MEKTKSANQEFHVPPLRTLNDFILESARFQLPNFRDLDKWGNRLVNNLLYYQTNYFFLAIIIFGIVGLIHPIKMLTGTIALIVIVLVFVYVSTEGRTVHNFKKEHPLLGIGLLLAAGCFLTYTLGSLLVLLIGILTPFSVVFVHASLRTRNILNKIVNKIESTGLYRTPMGILLEQLGMETQMFD